MEFTVEDPNVFTMAWSGAATYRKSDGTWVENSVVALASSAFQITTLSTQALIASAKKITITAGATCRLNDPLGDEACSGILLSQKEQ